MKILKIILFWILSLTWGCLLTIPGLIIGLFLSDRGSHFHYYPHFTFGGDDWGGLSLGPIIITDTDTTTHILQHESGHGVQNTLMGPFMLFIVSIPSMTRYWLREKKTVKEMKRFSIIEFIIFLIIGLAFILLPLFLMNGIGMWVLIGIGIAWIIYSIILCIWAAGIEAPKYEEGKSKPKYDDCWFEGDATRRGEKLFPNG